MLYHLFKYFDNVHNLPGAGMFQYISFRAAASIILALVRRSAIWGSKDNSRKKARPRWAA